MQNIIYVQYQVFILSNCNVSFAITAGAFGPDGARTLIYL